jgi:hypothetical protein
LFTNAALDPSRLTILCLGRTGLLECNAILQCGDFCTLTLIVSPDAKLKAMLGDVSVAVVRPDGYLLCAGKPEFVSSQLAHWFDRWIVAASDDSVAD